MCSKTDNFNTFSGVVKCEPECEYFDISKVKKEPVDDFANLCNYEAKPIKSERIKVKRERKSETSLNIKQEPLELVLPAALEQTITQPKDLKLDAKATQVLHECHICKLTFTRKELLDHKRTHFSASKKKPFKCSVCNKSFKCSTDLKKHKKDKKKDATHGTILQCKACGKLCPSSAALNKHLKSKVHRKKEETYKCTVCNKVFANAHGLRQHQQSMVHAKQFDCDICKEKCKRGLWLSLGDHIIEAHGETFGCAVCNKGFLSFTALNQHREAHRKKTSWVSCDLCGRSFGNSRLLDQHKHCAQHEVACDVCGKTFERSVLMKRHKIREHGQKKQQQPCGKLKVGLC